MPKQNFPAPFNMDSNTLFEEFRLESKSRSHKMKTTETFSKICYKKYKNIKKKKERKPESCKYKELI